jgi:hypothetical protein
MKKTSVAILSILFVFILSTFSPALGSYEVLAAVEKPKKLIINNKTEEKLTITFKGDTTYKFNLNPNKNKVELMAGMYSYTFFACGIWQNGTVDITKNNQKIILPDCATATGMVKLTIKNKTGVKVTLTLRGPAYYQFQIKPNKTEKEYLRKGTYTYSYEACGGKTTGTIVVETGKEKLTLPKCQKTSSQVAKVTVKNNTGGYIRINLTGPASYYFYLKPGTTQIQVIKGKYQYTCYGCGGASKSGTVNLRNGFVWTWFCY